MRIDNDYKAFCFHTEWYRVVRGVGYVSTDDCPQEAKKAMERVNAKNEAARN